ncbi:MAG: BCCT family transporter [Deltaproteobacteria bacterium]|jgi:glycine betaine transporter|nr:BCCT family transporter [Deltaproteobacteria bacterium]
MDALKRDNSTYYLSIAIISLLVLAGLIFPETFGAVSNKIFGFLSKFLGWWYMLAMNLFVAFPLILALSRFGKLTLGEENAKPEFSTLAWFGMLFGSGMGVGLVFYGVGEPLYHLASAPFGAEPGTPQAAEDALRAAFFHWGLHPWASYAVIALCLAYFQYRKGAPGLISSLLSPILGQNANKSVAGRLIDLLAIFATVAGIATSLGLAVMQINSGLKYMFGVPQNVVTWIAILVILAVIYVGTAVSGLNKGIRWLGNLNLALAAILSVALFLLGPTLAIVESFVTGVGNYLSNLVHQSFDLAPYGGPRKAWLADWTVFFWAWWMAWAPFVGSFIARISRGRTIRQFVAGVLIAPALGCFCWFSVFGGTALEMELNGIGNLAAQINEDLSFGVFAMYQQITAGGLMSALMVILICTFFITSGNSSTFTLSMYSSEGNLNPPKKRMLIWGVIQGAFALALLLSGGLKPLQIASIAAAAPFSIIMVLACFCLWRSLVKEFPRADVI